MQHNDKLDFNVFEQQLAKVAANKAVPAQVRIDIFKVVLKLQPAQPEKYQARVIRRLFDHDLNFAKWCLNDWEMHSTRAQRALKNIEYFFSQQPLPDEMSFAQHAQCCFCLAAFMSGVEPENLEHEYQKHLRTMVYGVVHPRSADWSIKSEFEHQDYAKYICHVSKTGFVMIKQINQMAAFRVKDEVDFCAVRIAAIGCGEQLEFDGVKEMEVDSVRREVRALELLKHDLIHAAFLKRHFEKDPVDYVARLAAVGEMIELINADAELAANEELAKKVELALFFWFHEYTTSTFIDGIPETLPRPHLRAHGEYAIEPQLLLRLAAKLKIFPALFKYEVNVEVGMFKHLGVELGVDPDDLNVSQHALVKEMMHQVNDGYAYLAEHFADSYNKGTRTHWRAALARRVVEDSSLGAAASRLFTAAASAFVGSPLYNPVYQKSQNRR